MSGTVLVRQEAVAAERPGIDWEVSGLATSGPNHRASAPQLGGETRSILDSVQDLNDLLAEYASIDQAETRQTVARSQSMRDILAQARRVAASKASVLIEGESGTGKELVARLIHFASPRATKPFVRVNCAALSESLIESELFGHEKGAFTGATEQRAGRFELADGGTLLLDEIGELSVKLQAKLLRVLEEEEFERVGGAKTLRVDARVIATTNRNLEEGIANGEFRRDLFYRLNVARLHIAPLRERREDIPALVAYFIWKFQHEASVPIRGLARRALELLMAYDWPGNVRQFRNVLHSACIHATGDQIEPHDLPPLESPAPSAHSFRGQTLEEIERHVILRTLRELGGNKTAAAARLGVTPRTLLNKMNRYRALGVA
jgi:transcriptional regulator with PAS, ATPase and Fis domain